MAQENGVCLSDRMGGLGHVLSIHLFQHHPGIAAVADITVTIDAAVREAAQEPPHSPSGAVRMHEGGPTFSSARSVESSRPISLQTHQNLRVSVRFTRNRVLDRAIRTVCRGCAQGLERVKNWQLLCCQAWAPSPL